MVIDLSKSLRAELTQLTYFKKIVSTHVTGNKLYEDMNDQLCTKNLKKVQA